MDRIVKMSLWILGLCWALGLLSPNGLVAQAIDATARGTAFDQSGAVLPGVLVRAKNTQNGNSRQSVTDAAGRYLISGLSAGSYDVQAEMVGFATQVRRGQEFNVGMTTTIDFTLSIAGVEESVEVTATTTLVEATQNVISRVIQKNEVDDLPVLSRSFSELAALTPGVRWTGGGFSGAGSIQVGGGGSYQNAVLVDGAASELQLDGSQRTGYSQEWIQEFQMMTNQFNAEYGQASGGVMNTITRSGGNTLHGRGYGYFRNDALDARNAAAKTKPPLDQQRYGGTIGGPIRKNQLFYFAGLERFDSDSSGIVATPFPEFNGNFPTTSVNTLTMLKLEYQPRDLHRLRIRFNRSKQTNTNTGVSGRGTLEHGTTNVGSGGDFAADWTWTVSPMMLNEARVAYGRLRSDRVCNYQRENPEGTWFERVYPSAAFGCLGFLGGNFERQHSLMDTFSLSRSGHQIRLGVQANRTAFHNDVRRNREGTYRFLTDKLFNFADPSTYPYYFYIVQGPIPFDFASWATGFFVQDSWALTGNLTLNYGIRYDLDPFFDQLEEYYQQGRYLHPIRTDTNNIAPRLGIAWSPFRDRRTVLRAGGGVYYDQSHGQLLATVMVNTVLVDRIINIDTSPSQSAALNPYHPDVATPRRILAQALSRNTIPDVSSFPTLKPTVNDVIENLTVPYTVQGTAGVQHDLGHGLTFSADFVYSSGRDQFLIKDVNIDENSLPKIVRPDSKYLAVYTHTNDGWYRSRSLLVHASFRPKPDFSLRVAYTLAKNTTNTAAGLFSGGPYATNPFDYSEDEGPADNDIRHDLNLSGGMKLPWGIEASSILKLSSALPFSVTTPAQLDSDPWPDRPEPRNSRRGDGPFSWDARLTKRIGIGERVSATGFIEAFNLTNTVTHTGFNGNMNSSLFLQPNNALDPRRVQLGFRVDF